MLRPRLPRRRRRRRDSSIRGPNPAERAYLVGWRSTRKASAASRAAEGASDHRGEPKLDELAELSELAASAGASVVGFALQRSAVPDPATLVGRGKATEVRQLAHAARADLVIFDNDLSPTQLRNLEEELGLKVIDRTQLILDIFARRARSREGQLQVELAQLNYLLPRLGGRGALLSRLGGGIGTRGPGEQKLESDRRRIRQRIRKLKAAIEGVRSQRALHRAHRSERQFLSVAMVGYTNAGKSTLFNALTQAGVPTSSRLFATLDPTVRSLALESRRPALLSDTVGFIQELPPHLVVSFRATLEELETANLLLMVTDAAHPENAQQDSAVETMLESLGLASTPRIHVWNKIDLLNDVQRRRLATGPEAGGGPFTVALSALTGEGLPALLQRIDESLGSDRLIEAEFEFSSSEGDKLAMLYRRGTVLSRHFENNRVFVRARIAESVKRQLRMNESKGLKTASLP